jgi:thiosulfate/3-mercaptopyruvate sulfurtransferase
MSKVDYLVSTQWLNDHLWDENLRILDVTAMLTKQRENRARQDCYDDGHIPNAVLFDVASGDGVLSDPNAALPWTWPTVDQFTQTMHDYGIDNETRVIIVAKSPREGIDSGTMWCTRAWWTMHHFGVDVAILKGGSNVGVRRVGNSSPIRSKISQGIRLRSMTTGSAAMQISRLSLPAWTMQLAL